MNKVNIGLALGSGSSRGWSHIGVVNTLVEQGIEPDIICGTSIGALVGASYVSNNLSKLEHWVRSLTKFETAKFFEINSSLNGFVNIQRLQQFFDQNVAPHDLLIEDLNKQFAAVATELETGREKWLTKGSVLDAVLASISIPGLFPAIKNNNKWLVDGSLVNPVPVSVCRALGADIVIAVNLNNNILGKYLRTPSISVKKTNGVVDKITDLITDYTSSIFPVTKPEEQPPGLFDAIATSFNITQDRITRSRMAGEPPDILLSPNLAHIGLLEFHRADEAISEGRRCVEKALAEIKNTLGIS